MEKKAKSIVRYKAKSWDSYRLFFQYARSREIKVCPAGIDEPARWIDPNKAPNPDYLKECVDYYINGDTEYNELEVREIVLTLIKRNRKTLNRKELISVCSVFDKCEKMVNRSDYRKNSNTHEADTSYKFAMSGYRKICDIIKKGGCK